MCRRPCHCRSTIWLEIMLDRSIDNYIYIEYKYTDKVWVSEWGEGGSSLNPLPVRVSVSVGILSWLGLGWRVKTNRVRNKKQSKAGRDKKINKIWLTTELIFWYYYDTDTLTLCILHQWINDGPPVLPHPSSHLYLYLFLCWMRKQFVCCYWWDIPPV